MDTQKMTKKEFEKLYYAMSAKEICEHLKISVSTLYRYVKVQNITKKRQWSKKKKKIIFT